MKQRGSIALSEHAANLWANWAARWIQFGIGCYPEQDGRIVRVQRISGGVRTLEVVLQDREEVRVRVRFRLEPEEVSCFQFGLEP